MLSKFKKSRGFTLAELMIALAINTLLFSGLIAIFVATLSHYRQTININRLNQQLQAVLDVMAADIKRAGYWANARNDINTNQNNNPFMASGTDLTVSGSCILLTYDKDSNGSLPAVNSAIDDERYGFRLNNGAVQARPPGAVFACNAAASAWENMTDTNVIQITALTFALTTKNVVTGPGSRGITMRSVDITITGRLASNNSITKTLTEHVRIRNDKFIP